MNLPKLLPLQLTTDAYSVVTEKNPMLTDRQAAECIRRVELHDELVEALRDMEQTAAQVQEVCGGTLEHQAMYSAQKKAQAVLNKSQGADK